MKRRRRWLEAHKTDAQTAKWKQDLIGSLQTARSHAFEEHPELLRPTDGSVFYAPRAGVDEQRIEGMAETILEYMNRRSDPPGAGTSLADFAAEASASNAQEHLENLVLLASRGDVKALEVYAQTTRTMVQMLNRFAQSHKEQLRKSAGTYPNWPVLLGRSSIYSDDFKPILAALEVGSRLPFSQEAVAKLKNKAHKRALKLAMELACRLEDWRSRDPSTIYWYRPLVPSTLTENEASSLLPFSNSTWYEWFWMAWSIVLEENHGHPEFNPELRPLGLHRAKHSLQQEQQKNLTDGTRESNIRDGIRERLRKAFSQLAR